MGKLLIAGPCSAETREQTLATAAGLGNVDYFRAGLWKPRSQPGTFEGIGEAGLDWLSDVKKEYGLKTCTEVASACHVDLCLGAGVDALWIGARTTTNPFLVQEIADALKGSSVKVLVKNPVSPDIRLWAGAVERISEAGIKDIILVHRGFSTGNQTKYRNEPLWRVAFEMRSLFPSTPILCDASHMAGSTSLVPEIAQKAMDLGLDGLMIETHIDPSSALSDSAQQLTPDELAHMLAGLNIRENSCGSDSINVQIEKLREEIDSIDTQIIDALSARMEVSRRIGTIKKANNISVLQSKRMEELMQRLNVISVDKGLRPDFIKEIYNIIHNESVEEQS